MVGDKEVEVTRTVRATDATFSRGLDSSSPPVLASARRVPSCTCPPLWHWKDSLGVYARSLYAHCPSFGLTTSTI